MPTDKFALQVSVSRMVIFTVDLPTRKTHTDHFCTKKLTFIIQSVVNKGHLKY